MNNCVKTWIQQAAQTLESISETARLDAELLLAACLQQNRTWLMTWPDYVLTQKEQKTSAYLLQRRQQGQPIAYLLGYRDFWTLRLKVSPAVLIPRPETELLVETALEKLPEQKILNVLDLGTGSGAIALAIASERPLANIIALDKSEKALIIAEENADQYALKKVQFLQSYWFDALSNEYHYGFDLIVSNPPYIAESDPHLNQDDVRFEPRLALTSRKKGLTAIQHIILEAPQWLKKEGYLILEHGYDQQQAVLTLLKQAGFSNCLGLQDLAGVDRLCLGR